jgi:MinD-like ATPase involved in chromosome partitioning or flagellar assembly
VLSFFAAKGGVGCSVVAAAAALLASADTATLLVDLDGDQRALLGLAEADDRPGIAEWFDAEDPLPDALRRLEVPVSAKLSLLPFGSGSPTPRPDQLRLLARLLSADGRRVIIDVGTTAGQRSALLDASDHAVLVTRACYLALRAARSGPAADAVALVCEPGRALSPGDVASALGTPVRAVIRWDPAVCRAVDAGLLASRLPRQLRELSSLVDATSTPS